MKISARHEYSFPLDMVIQVTHHEIVHNIEKFKETLELKDARRTHYVKHPDGREDVEFTVCVHKSIPPIAQAILKPHMLTWKQVSRWDPETLTYTYEIVPFFFRDSFYCKGVWKYEQSDGKVIQSMEGQLNVKLPIIGGLVEQTISKELSKSQRKLFLKHMENLKHAAAAEPVG